VTSLLKGGLRSKATYTGDVLSPNISVTFPWAGPISLLALLFGLRTEEPSLPDVRGLALIVALKESGLRRYEALDAF